MIPLFSGVFFLKFPLREQKAADHVDPWCRKLQVNLVTELSVGNVVAQALACLLGAKRVSKNGMIPLVSKLKSTILKSKLLCILNSNIGLNININFEYLQSTQINRFGIRNISNYGSVDY